MTVPVVWMPPSCWDQSMMRALLDGRLARVGFDFEHVDAVDGMVPTVAGGGAVVVCPARYYTPSTVNALIAHLTWVLLILVSDEESTFDHRSLTHPNLRLWVMTPRVGQHAAGDARFIGEGWAPHLPALLEQAMDEPVRRYDWSFAGQVNHERRRSLVDVLQHERRPGRLEISPGFTQGLDHGDYARLLANTKVVPCPSGPATPDSFRLYEALEAGCIPVADATCPRWADAGYWELLLGETPPFPVVDGWPRFPTVLDGLLDAWQAKTNLVQSWWQQYKRSHGVWLDSDLAALGATPRLRTVDDQITVLMPTSPIPSHPSTAVITETIASIRAQLPTAEILIMVDGLRPELEHRRGDYDEYTRRLLKLTASMPDVTPIVHDEHLHQGLMTRHALDLVRTPLVLFVEHDTPIFPPIPFDDLAAAVFSGDAHVVRLHHEAHVLNAHRHLMLDRAPVDVHGAPMLRTAQWSQRPHLAWTDFYRDIAARYFGSESRTMIEDVMHGVLDHFYRTMGVQGWDRFRVWMYAPDGDMKRSGHLDGRETDPKFDDRFIYAYDGTDVPAGAPYPTKLRVD